MGQQEIIDCFASNGNHWYNGHEIAEKLGNPRFENKVCIIAARMKDIVEYERRFVQCPRGTRKHKYYRLKPEVYKRLKHK